MPDLKEPLRARGLLRQIVLPPAVDALLGSLQPDAPVPAGADVRGTASLGVSGTPLGFLSLDLRPPGPSIPFHLVSDETAGSFRLWLVLSATPPAKKLFGFAAGLPGAVLKPATLKSGGGEEWLEPAAGDVALAGAAVTLLIEGRAGQSATMELSPTDGQPAGLITFGLDPPAVLLGSTGFGLELPDGVTLDDSDQAVPPGHTVVAGRQITTQADTAAWRGLVARKARFFLPRGVPFFGGHAVDAYVEVTRAPGHGIDLAVSTKWRAPGNGKEIDVLIECRDPAATGLQDFLPTLVEASLTLPVEKARPSVNGQGFTMLAGKPVVARVRFARTSSDPTTRMTLALESQGENGVLSVVSPAGGPAAHAVISAAALATAIVAE